MLEFLRHDAANPEVSLTWSGLLACLALKLIRLDGGRKHDQNNEGLEKMSIAQINFLTPFAVCTCSTQLGTSFCSGNAVVDLQIMTNI